jgi:arginase
MKKCFYFLKMSIFKKLIINNLRCAFGQKKKGVELGGDVILSRLPQSIQTQTCEFKDFESYGDAYNLVYNKIRQNFCLNLGGDHSIAASTVRPLLDIYKDDLLVVWIDAHPDVNTLDTSITKSLHGTPVASLLGLQPYWYMEKKTTPHPPPHNLNPQNLAYFGIRDIDPPEASFIEQLKIPVYHKTDELIKFIDSHPAKHIHISCDIDGIDPETMSATGTPVKDGLTQLSVQKVIRHCMPRLISLDLVEFNPLLGDSKKTVDNILELLEPLEPLHLKDRFKTV